MGDLLSGSRLPIARHCTYAFRPDVTFPENRSKGDQEDADEGSDNHELFSTFVETGNFPPLRPSQKIVCDHVKSFWGGRGRWSVETAYALNPRARTVRLLGNRIGRKYVVEPGEIPLTLDYEGYFDSMLTVGDWKGFGAHVEEPRDNLQLLAEACASSLYAQQNGRPPGPVRIEIPHVTDRGVWAPDVVVSPLVLSAAMDEMVAIQERVAGAPPVPGDHCRYCEANGACPATSARVATIAGTTTAQWTSEFVSEDNDRAILRELGAVKKALEAIERATKGRYPDGIDMGDGYRYKMIVSHRTVFDKQKVEEFLGDRYGEFTKQIEYEQFRKVKA